MHALTLFYLLCSIPASVLGVDGMKAAELMKAACFLTAYFALAALRPLSPKHPLLYISQQEASTAAFPRFLSNGTSELLYVCTLC